MPVSKLLKLPYGSYLMVRLDYKIICADELEAKIMRIIEMYMDIERTIIYRELLNDPQNNIDQNAETEVTRDVWVAISHRLFKNDLYDQDMSENTLKRALKSLRKKNFILVRDKGLTRYEAPKYQINTEVVQAELNLLAKIGKTEYQKLMVSKIDGIKNASHQKETPSDHQILTVSSDSRVSKIDGNSRRVYEVEERVEESTCLQPESQLDDSGSVEPTRTHSQDAQNETLSQSQDEPKFAGTTNYAGKTWPDGSVTPGEHESRAQLSTLQQSSPQQRAKVSRSSRVSAKAPSSKLPPTAEPTAPAMPPADAEWKTTTCLLMFTAWRGKPLLAKHQNIHASQCAKALAANYTRAQVEAVRTYMVEQDEWWSQHPEKVDVCSVGAHIHEKLAEMARKGKPATKPKPTLVSCANMSAEEYAAYLRR